MKSNVDPAAVQKLCKRLGIEYDVQAEDRGLRDQILHCLSRDVEALERLAGQCAVTLYNLSVNKLVPSPLRIHICGRAPLDGLEYDGKEKGFHREVGTLTKYECGRFQLLPHFGHRAVETIMILADLHRQTNGFRALLGEALSATEQESLVSPNALRHSTDERLLLCCT